MKPDDTFENRQRGIASEEYDEEKEIARQNGMPHTVTIRMIEIRHGFKKDELTNYRANHISRKRKSRNDLRRI